MRVPVDTGNGVCTHCGSRYIHERHGGSSGTGSQALLFLLAIAIIAGGFALAQPILYGVGLLAMLLIFVVPKSGKLIRKCLDCNHEWSL